MSFRMALISSFRGVGARSCCSAAPAFNAIDANGDLISWAIAAVAAPMLARRLARSRRCIVRAAASREYSIVISANNKDNSMQLAIRAERRTAYQPMENRTELATAATRKFGNQANNVTISHRSST